ncbi:MAG: response regulator [Candidatus Omnitrophica bacterium]|nr:response regulator [Candidatus Omnitrophota bacterium]
METGLVDILLVEDNQNDAELTLRALKKVNLGERVFVARDGAEALEFLFASGAYSDRGAVAGPRLVLLDLKLPKVDGLEVLRRIKGNEATRIIPVVILTSSKEQRDISEAYRLGANSYIAKEVDFNKFSRAIAELGLYWLFLNQPAR